MVCRCWGRIKWRNEKGGCQLSSMSVIIFKSAVGVFIAEGEILCLCVYVCLCCERG